MAPEGRIHITTADGFVTDLDGNAVALYASDARSPEGDKSYFRPVADVVAYRESDGEWMKLHAVRVKGLHTAREMGRIEVRIGRDSQPWAWGSFGFGGDLMGDTRAGQRLLAAVSQFYVDHPELTSKLSDDAVRESHLRDAVARTRIPSEAYWAGREYLNAGGSRDALRKAVLDEFVRRLDEEWSR